MGKIKKVDQKKEVFADVLNLLKAAFRDSYLCMQTQVLQHYPPSSVFLAAINMKIPKVFFLMQKKSENHIIFNVEAFTVCHHYHLYIKKCFLFIFLTIFLFHPSFLKKHINICICIILCFL